jgi:GAF domain-containing protein
MAIGAHISVPIRLPDGRPYGMFCCLGFEADHSLNERDLQMMKAFADLAAFEINRDLQAESAAAEKRARVAAAIKQRQLSIVYQAIWNVQDQRPVARPMPLESALKLCDQEAAPALRFA